MNLMDTFRRWSSYRTTVRELNALADRDLEDLGISRGDIETLAREHAYRS